MALAKLLKMREGRGSFRRCIEYISRGEQGDKVHEDVAWVHTINVASVETAASEMWAASQASLRARRVVEHWIYSPAAGESLTQAEAVADIERQMIALGLDPADHQAVIACHRDTDHQHYHVVVNRVSLATGQTNWEADRGSYERLESEVARIAIDRGWSVVAGWHNKSVVSEAGLQPGRVAGRPDASQEIKRRRGEDYADAIRDDALRIRAASDSWLSMRAGLADAGIEMQPVRRGGNIIGLTYKEMADLVPAGQKARGCSGTKLDASLSLKQMEAQFGPIEGFEQIATDVQPAPVTVEIQAPTKAPATIDFASEIRPAVMAAADAATSWADYHDRLAAAGLEVHAIQRGPRIQGLAIGELSDRVAEGSQARTIGASKIDPAVSIAKLTARWGEWTPAAEGGHMNIVDPHATADLPASDDAPATDVAPAGQPVEAPPKSIWLAPGVADIYEADLTQLGLVDPPTAQAPAVEIQAAQVLPARPARATQEEEIQPAAKSIWIAENVMDIYSADLVELGLVEPPAVQPAETKEQEEEIQPARRVEPPAPAAQAREARAATRLAAVIDNQSPDHDDHSLWSGPSRPRRSSSLGRVDKDREIEAMGAVNEIWQEEKQIRRAEEALVTEIKRGATRYNKIRCKVEREILGDYHRSERDLVRTMMMDYGIVGLVLGAILGTILAVRQAEEQAELRRYQQWRRQVEREALQRHVRAHYAKYRVEYYKFVQMVAAGTPPAGIRTDDERQEHGRIALARIDRGRALQDAVWRAAGMDPDLCRAHPVVCYLTAYKRLQNGDTSVEKGLDELAGSIMAMKRHSPTLVLMLAKTDLQKRHDRLEEERIAKRKAAAEALAELRKRQLAAATAMVEKYQEQLGLMRVAHKSGEVAVAGKIAIGLEDLAVRLTKATRSKHVRPPMPIEVKADIKVRLRNRKARAAVPAAPPPRQQATDAQPRRAAPPPPPPPKANQVQQPVRVAAPTKPAPPPPPRQAPAPAPQAPAAEPAAPAPTNKWWTDQVQ